MSSIYQWAYARANLQQSSERAIVRKTTDNISHWSKDFVEHLRTVHFALLAVSAGLLVLAISKSDYNARKARIEIEEIARMKSEGVVTKVGSGAEPYHGSNTHKSDT
jgi:hypothetical protein